MRFHYEKTEHKLVVGDVAPWVSHKWTLEGSTFSITASQKGVFFSGSSPLYQPVDEEMRIPEEFRELLVKFALAFDMAFKEQEKIKRETAARQTILGIK